MVFQVIYKAVSFLCSIPGSRIFGPFLMPILPVPIIPMIPLPGPILYFVAVTINYFIYKDDDYKYWDSMKSIFPYYYIGVAAISFLFFGLTCKAVEFIESGFGVL